MKRGGPLRRKTPMERKPLPRKAPPKPVSGPLRPPKPPARRSSQPKRARPQEPGEQEWKRDRNGVCAACGRRGKIRLHHVVREQDIRQLASQAQVEAGIVYDLRNALGLGAPYAMGGNPSCQCHANHHARGISDRRLSISLVPESARQFAIELMGIEGAWTYLERHYKPKEES